jgi:hypothetical protein
MTDTQRRLVSIFQKISRISLVGFLSGVIICIPITLFIDSYKSIALPLGVCAVLLIMVSGPIYICSLIARDFIALHRMRFSLQTLLVAVTVLAIGLGVLMLALRS